MSGAASEPSLSNGAVLLCSRCLQFNQFSVPLSFSNMNNVHNTFFVATWFIMYFLSQLKKKTMLSLPLAFYALNALESAMFVVPRRPRDFRTCAIWFTLSRAGSEPIDKCEMNFRWIVQIHATWQATEYFRKTVFLLTMLLSRQSDQLRSLCSHKVCFQVS